VVQLDVSVVNVAINPIGADLGAGVGTMQWVVSAYTVAFAALILTAGALGDRIGAKRVFIAGFALFTGASALCGAAPSAGVLIAARALQGTGAAVLVPCSLTLLSHAYPAPLQRARAVGLWAAGASTALSAGPLIGGVLTATLGWRSIFFINAPIGLAGIAITARWAPDTPRTGHRGVDLAGQSAAVLALTALAAATIEGGSHGFTAPLVLAGFALAAVAAAVFVVVEARSTGPMLPLKLFRSANFSSATAMGVVVNIAFYGLIFVLSLFFQRQQHMSALRTGLAFVPMTAAILAANVTAGRLAHVLRPRVIVTAGAVAMTAGSAALLRLGLVSGYGTLVAPFIALGFGLGLVVPAMTASLLGTVDRSRSGVASGTLNTARQTGSVVGVALYGALIAGGRFAAGLHSALLITVGLSVLVAGLAAGIGRGAGR
jgi:DHA2 family methylenomycin A resistance protein-like MFS transporter